MARDESTEKLPREAAEQLAELTDRPAEEFESDAEIPNFEDQELIVDE